MSSLLMHLTLCHVNSDAAKAAVKKARTAEDMYLAIG